MIYLNLFEIFKTIKNTDQNQEQKILLQLTFNITNSYPDKIYETKNHIIIGSKNSQNFYSLLAMNLNKRDIDIINKIKYKVIIALIELGIEKYNNENINKTQNIVMGFLANENLSENKELIAYLIAHDIIGYGPLSIILEDSKNIEEILINSPVSEIMIFHQKYGYCKTNLRFNSEREFRFVINKLLESLDRELNSDFPIIDANVFNEARLHAQLKPYATNGAIAVIRLNQNKIFNIRKLIQTNTANINIIAYLWLAIEVNLNIIISGAPAAGKTSLLISLSSLMPRYQRIISVEEDINEIKLNSNFINSVALQGSTNKNLANIQNQVINSLRLRPDRLIIGEIRGNETNEIFSGSNFGVPFMTTMHSSENGKTLINRLSSRPMNVQPQLISMLDISIFMKQNINSRKLDSICEYKWLMRNEINMKEIDKNTETDNDIVFKILDIVVDGKLNHKILKKSKVIAKYSKIHLISINEAIIELEKRVLFLSQIDQGQNCSKSIEDFILEYNNISD